MARYFLAYMGTGGAMAPTPEEQQKVMAAWGAWMGRLGGKLVDPGAPVNPQSSVTKSGTTQGTSSGFGGWSIVTADDLEGAIAATEGCPHLDAGGTIEVFQVQ